MDEVNNKARGSRKTMHGVVVSRSGDKSVVVLIETRKAHPRYGKIFRQRRKFHAHDEKNEAEVGDRVVIVESRPMSRTKHWRLAEVIVKGA